jgi:iron complex outermembrane receptor protein
MPAKSRMLNIACLSGVSLVALTAALPGAALAQESQQARRSEAVVVTGSRIATLENQQISPVRILSGDEIRASVELDIDELLKQQNQFLPSNGGTTNPAQLESHGASTIDMRGLGQNRSLVLVNGQRVTPNGFRNSVDVNVIPAAMIARIETLTGGAAAVYGADAVAGVTNFILRDSFEGLEVTASGNTAEEGDAQSWSVGITGGMNFMGDRGNIVLHAGYTDRGGMKREDRSWALPEVDDLGNLFAQTFPTPGGAFYRWANATTAPVTTGAPTFAYSRAGTLQNTAETQAFSQFEAFQNPNDRTNAALFAKFRFSDFAEVYGRATYTIINNVSQQVPVRSNSNPNALATSQRIPGAVFGAGLQQADVLIQRTNPFITPAILGAINAAGGFNLNAAGTAAGSDAVRLRTLKTLTELGALTDDTERENYQVVIGLRGDITSTIRYDLSYVTGKNVEIVTRNGWGSLQRWLQATNATTVNGQAACVDASNGCVPFNLFGPEASSAASRAWILGSTDDLFNKRSRHQDVLMLNISGDTSGLFELPAGPIGWVVGAERREEFGNSLFGARAFLRDNLHGQGVRDNLVAEFAMTEYFGELRVPLLKELPLIEALDLELAGRQTDHERIPDYDTWKVGLSWAVTPDFRLRGSKQTVVRGPNIGEFFGAATQVPITGAGRPTDYCSDPARFGVPAALCAATGAPSTTGYLPLQGATNLPLIDNAFAIQGGGGGAIEAESGETFTYGFVYQPDFLPGLSILLDYYKITLDGAIGSVSPIQSMEGCYLILQDAGSRLCRNIRRGADGRVTTIEQRDTNLALIETSGWDFTLNYSADMPEGLPGDRIFINFNAGIVEEYVRLDFAGANIFNCAGKFGTQANCGDAGSGIRAVPEYRHNLAVAWTADKLTIRGNWRVQGEVDALIGETAPPGWRGVFTPNRNLVKHIPTWDYFDLGFTYRITDDLRISGTINNVFDKEPPILGSAQQDANTLPAQYDIIGRRFGLNITWRYN